MKHKAIISKVLIGLVIICTIGFLYYNINSNVLCSVAFESIAFIGFTVWYLIYHKEQNFFFKGFLIANCLSTLYFLGDYIYFNFGGDMVNNEVLELDYYFINGLCMIAYVFLIFYVIRPYKILFLFKKLPYHCIFMFFFSIFSTYYISQISFERNIDLDFFESSIEVLYSFIILTLLMFSLLNYLIRHSIKAMYLVLGSLCVISFEYLWIGYYYISSKVYLLILHSIFYVLAFYFFFTQVRMNYSEDKMKSTDAIKA